MALSKRRLRHMRKALARGMRVAFLVVAAVVVAIVASDIYDAGGLRALLQLAKSK